jgi:hypothetical protein
MLAMPAPYTLNKQMLRIVLQDAAARAGQRKTRVRATSLRRVRSPQAFLVAEGYMLNRECK